MERGEAGHVRTSASALAGVAPPWPQPSVVLSLRRPPGRRLDERLRRKRARTLRPAHVEVPSRTSADSRRGGQAAARAAWEALGRRVRRRQARRGSHGLRHVAAEPAARPSSRCASPRLQNPAARRARTRGQAPRAAWPDAQTYGVAMCATICCWRKAGFSAAWLNVETEVVYVQPVGEESTPK